MEYILLALSESQAPMKARLAKLRHLDSLFFFLLILALLSFHLFQHRQLREELLARRTDYMLEEFLQERLPQLEREIEDLRGLLSEGSAQIEQKLQENKLTLQLGRQLGLPLRTPEPEDPPHQPLVEREAEAMESSNYEVIEIEPESNSEEDCDADEQADSSEDTAEADTFPQEEVITASERRQACTYLQYLSEGGDGVSRSVWSRPSKQPFGINTSSYERKGRGELEGKRFEEMRRVAEGVGKVILIAVLIAVALLLTIQKRRRGKHSKSFLRDIWRKVWPEYRRRVKEWKEKEEWREEKQWREDKQWRGEKELQVL